MDEKELVKDLKSLFDKYVNAMDEDSGSSTLRVMSDIWFFLEENNSFDEALNEQLGDIVDG